MKAGQGPRWLTCDCSAGGFFYLRFVHRKAVQRDRRSLHYATPLIRLENRLFAL